MQQSKVSVKYSEENSVFWGVSYYLLLEFLWEGVGWGGRLFEAERLLNFSAFRMGAYSRWALIRGWALNRINTVSRKNKTKNVHLLKISLLVKIGEEIYATLCSDDSI